MNDDNFDRPLTDDEQRALLQIARASIEAAVKRQPPPALRYEFPIFREKRGAFVTITKQEKLRGCIGYVLAAKSLADTIAEMAMAAALRDPRFSPVTEGELAELHIEISVLSPLREIDDISIIKVGLHGLYIKKGMFAGLLLPQVAEKHGWDRQEFLRQTCLKAGLPPEAWQDKDTHIEIFSAHVFAE